MRARFRRPSHDSRSRPRGLSTTDAAGWRAIALPWEHRTSTTWQVARNAKIGGQWAKCPRSRLTPTESPCIDLSPRFWSSSRPCCGNTGWNCSPLPRLSRSFGATSPWPNGNLSPRVGAGDLRLHVDRRQRRSCRLARRARLDAPIVSDPSRLGGPRVGHCHVGVCNVEHRTDTVGKAAIRPPVTTATGRPESAIFDANLAIFGAAARSGNQRIARKELSAIIG